MIDIHSHVLPGLDDGARSIEEALRMLQLAAGAGTTDIVATPHISPAFPNNFEIVNPVFAELSKLADGIVRLHLGCDFHLTYDNLQEFLLAPRKYTINNLRYLLVEFSEFIPFGPVTEALARILEEGVVPVITHPERNRSLQADSRKIASWVASGCICQITGQSFLGRFGARARVLARALVKEGLAHVVASDGHDLVYRPPVLEPAYRYLVSSFGQPLADQLCIVNPAAIIRGEVLPRAVKPLSFWSRLRQHRSS